MSAWKACEGVLSILLIFEEAERVRGRLIAACIGRERFETVPYEAFACLSVGKGIFDQP